MFSSIIHNMQFNMVNVFICMGSALLLGLLIALFYMKTGDYTKNFVVVLALIPLLVQTIILIVNGNIGTSVAVLGAFGLVRFRSAPGSARDIGSIFFAMAVGLAVGMGLVSFAFVVTFIVGLVMIILSLTKFGESDYSNKQLKITVPENLNYTDAFDDLLMQYTKKYTLNKVKTTNMGTMYELFYHVILKDINKEKEFIDELRCRNGNLTIMIGIVPHSKDEL